MELAHCRAVGIIRIGVGLRLLLQGCGCRCLRLRRDDRLPPFLDVQIELQCCTRIVDAVVWLPWRLESLHGQHVSHQRPQSARALLLLHGQQRALGRVAHRRKGRLDAQRSEIVARTVADHARATVEQRAQAVLHLRVAERVGALQVVRLDARHGRAVVCDHGPVRRPHVSVDHRRAVAPDHGHARQQITTIRRRCAVR